MAVGHNDLHSTGQPHVYLSPSCLIHSKAAASNRLRRVGAGGSIRLRTPLRINKLAKCPPLAGGRISGSFAWSLRGYRASLRSPSISKPSRCASTSFIFTHRTVSNDAVRMYCLNTGGTCLFPNKTGNSVTPELVKATIVPDWILQTTSEEPQRNRCYSDSTLAERAMCFAYKEYTAMQSVSHHRTLKRLISRCPSCRIERGYWLDPLFRS